MIDKVRKRYASFEPMNNGQACTFNTEIHLKESRGSDYLPQGVIFASMDLCIGSSLAKRIYALNTMDAPGMVICYWFVKLQKHMRSQLCLWAGRDCPKCKNITKEYGAGRAEKAGVGGTGLWMPILLGLWGGWLVEERCRTASALSLCWWSSGAYTTKSK